MDAPIYFWSPLSYMSYLSELLQGLLRHQLRLESIDNQKTNYCRLFVRSCKKQLASCVLIMMPYTFCKNSVETSEAVRTVSKLRERYYEQATIASDSNIVIKAVQ